MSNLLSNVEFRRVLGYNAASTTNRKATIVDMAGYEGVTFVLTLGTMLNTGTVVLKAAQGDENDTAKMTESVATTGTVTSDGTDNVQLVLDVIKPKGRYVEAQVELDTANSLIEGIVAILHGPRDKAVSQPDAVLAAKTFQSPVDA